MLDSNYVQSIQDDLTKHYRDDITGHDEHHVTIFTSPETDDAWISYQPVNLVDPRDNDGKITPVRTVWIKAVAQENQWTKLINQQFIQVHPDSKGNPLLNFNFRNDDAISEIGQQRLAKALRNRFRVELTGTGLLSVPVGDVIIRAFSSLIDSIRFINSVGYRFVIKSR